MDTFNYKCAGCGANLEYDVESKLMFCQNCGEFYPLKKSQTNVKVDLGDETQEWHEKQNGNEDCNKSNTSNWHEKNPDSYSPNFMEVNIFHCSSCGAEIMTNDVEVSKNCAYCGQSTIIFDRVSKEQRPDVILPFKLTKKEALSKAKERFAKAKYLPDDIDNVSVESVYGIYMPYWVYDSNIQMGVKGKFTVNKTVYNLDEFGSKDMLVTLDASKRLNDNISIQLNPFPTEEFEEFDPGYLSGFFGDRFDVEYDKRKDDAKEVIADLLEDDLVKGKPGVPSKLMRMNYGEIYDKFNMNQIHRYAVKFKLKDIMYAFLPVYFITFRIKEQLINILVNGASGKVIGTVPVDEDKLDKARIKEMIIWGIIMGAVGAVLFRYMPTVWSFLIFAIMAACTVVSGKKAKEKFETTQSQANSEAMFDISRHRE